MNAPDRFQDWTDANQRLLVAEFARLKQRLAGDDDTLARTEADALRAAMARPAAIDVLAQAFALSAFERFPHELFDLELGLVGNERVIDLIREVERLLGNTKRIGLELLLGDIHPP